ncbi:MAG: anhydro-N-acetylmuramic acid kinase [Candidatus Latescibacteria bacterium]|nr:anhydro-N-acetylmuramic acid kinase [Candidatus Latescibacterota bacterium]
MAAKKRRRVVGLMSGTSADGIDAVLVDLWGCGESTRYEVLSFNTTPLPSDLRREVFALFAEDASLGALCRVNFALGEAFATAALATVEQAKLGPESIDLIGSHGQTVRHLPASGATLQIGEPAVIAARTGAVTIADFRTADMAVGGEGAPLVPLVDHLLFAHRHEGRLLLNIGGIANITALPANADTSAVRAFDLGPGNMLIDAAVAHCTEGCEEFDRGGERAAQGHVDETLLAELMRHSFLQREPPKSTGREEFGEPFLAEILRRDTWSDSDLIATLTAFTVQSIAEGIRRFCPGEFAKLWVGGGGVHNPRIMAGLQHALPDIAVQSLAELGVDPDAREALSFMGRTGNIPAVTRAQRPVVLGKIALP